MYSTNSTLTLTLRMSFRICTFGQHYSLSRRVSYSRHNPIRDAEHVSIENIPETPPFRPSQLAASYLRTSRLHHEQINSMFTSVHYQHEAIRVATSSLDLHVLAIFDTFDSLATNSKRELQRQSVLLEGLNSDLELIKRVCIHVDFMSNAVRRAIEAGERHRTLGDYVSTEKMRTVAAGCARTHGVHLSL